MEELVKVSGSLDKNREYVRMEISICWRCLQKTRNCDGIWKRQDEERTSDLNGFKKNYIGNYHGQVDFLLWQLSSVQQSHFP